jgi:RNA polymerase sigma-70 factor (ECF subfamily)
MPDAELARQYQAGSLAAFEELAGRYEHRVHAFVRQFCRNATDARELTQDTFVKASQCMNQFDARREFAPWLFTIARRKCIDRHRTAPPVADAPVPDTADEANPRDLLAAAEDRQQLWRLARRCLKPGQFQALWFRYAEDLDVAQIAQVLGLSRVHVKVLLFRARQGLARQLKNARDFDPEAEAALRPGPLVRPAAAVLSAETVKGFAKT